MLVAFLLNLGGHWLGLSFPSGCDGVEPKHWTRFGQKLSDTGYRKRTWEGRLINRVMLPSTL